MDTFLAKYNLPRLNSDDLEKMTGLMPRTENDVVRKKLPAGIPVGANWNEPDPYRREGRCNPWIQDCLQIWSRSQMQLGSGLAVAVAGSCSCSANSTIARAFPNAMGLP